jgi:hypothetical protein
MKKIIRIFINLGTLFVLKFEQVDIVEKRVDYIIWGFVSIICSFVSGF